MCRSDSQDIPPSPESSSFEKPALSVGDRPTILRILSEAEEVDLSVHRCILQPTTVPAVSCRMVTTVFCIGFTEAILGVAHEKYRTVATLGTVPLA